MMEAFPRIRQAVVALIVLLTYLSMRWIPSVNLPRAVGSLFVVWLSMSYKMYKFWGPTPPDAPYVSTARYAELTLLPVLMLFLVDATFGTWMTDPFHELAFAKLGHIGAHHAQISMRAPGLGAAHVCYSPEAAVEDKHCFDVILPGNDTQHDNVLNAQLDGLDPDTPYFWSVTAETENGPGFLGLGSFRSAHTPGQAAKWSFAATSCIIPSFPYNPLRRNPIYGFEDFYRAELEDKPASDRPAFMLFLGDFIYYDLPHFPKLALDAYYQKYRTVYASESFRPVYMQLPFVHVYDDHDVVNNYDGGEATERYSIAHTAFDAYHGQVNPPPGSEGQTWYKFARGGVDFFMMDTRRYRSQNALPDGVEKTMLGAEQLADLLAWLGHYGEGIVFKVMISSVPFTRNWLGVDGHLDTWGGFLHERALILAAVKAARRDVTCITGDRHEFAATEVSSPEDEGVAGVAKVLDLSIGPLSQFYLPIRTYWPHKGDRIIDYTPWGNVKWGRFDVDTTATPPRIDFGLKVYGRPALNHTIYGQ